MKHHHNHASNTEKCKPLPPANSILALRAIYISNDVYGSEICSGFALAKGHSEPIVTDILNPLPDNLCEVQENLTAKRKQTLILRSKSEPNDQLSAGDSVKIFVKNKIEKKGRTFVVVEGDHLQ